MVAKVDQAIWALGPSSVAAMKLDPKSEINGRIERGLIKLCAQEKHPVLWQLFVDGAK